MSSARPLPRPRKAPAPVPASPITVLLVDDHAFLRKGIRALLRHEPDIVVVGEAEDGRRAVAKAKALDPDVVLMDIGMPVMNGIEATRHIARVAPRSRVLILSAHSDDHYIKGVIASGAAGYVLKQSSLADLAGAIRKTGQGGTVINPLVRKRLFKLLPRKGKAGGARRHSA